MTIVTFEKEDKTRGAKAPQKPKSRAAKSNIGSLSLCERVLDATKKTEQKKK